MRRARASLWLLPALALAACGPAERGAPASSEPLAARAEALPPGYRAVSWSELGAYAYAAPGPGALEDLAPAELAARNAELIPAQVRALDGTRVAIRGYPIPAELRDGRMTRFILSAQSANDCCFGEGLGIQEWIEVEAGGADGPEVAPFRPVTVLGRLEVGEDVRRGTVLSLYRMRAERCLAASDPSSGS